MVRKPKNATFVPMGILREIESEIGKGTKYTLTFLVKRNCKTYKLKLADSTKYCSFSYYRNIENYNNFNLFCSTLLFKESR